jgi:thymidylate synthase
MEDRSSMRHYTANRARPFADTYRQMKSDILAQPLIAVGQWQSQASETLTRELMGVVLEYFIPDDATTLGDDTGANFPWAEDHFQERVGGLPLNPPPSEKWWPFNQQGNAAHKFQKDGEDAKFSHTYPERFWPKYAGDQEAYQRLTEQTNRGIRYELGDLWDLVELLRRAPGTRQAYLPVWFPEDTGTVHGGRVPCTLGYHFLIRGERLHCWYYMRSCDLMRHFPDDVYMAGRLMQWICHHLADLGDVMPGVLTMDISSLHTFEHDDYALTRDTRLAGGTRR